MIFLSTAEAEKSWISSIEDSLGIIGNIQTLYSVLVVIALIINIVLARENTDKVKELIDKLANRSSKKDKK